MASNRLDSNVNRENLVHSTQHLNTKDAASSSRAHSVKKQAFSEIKNVIHNQSQMTPFKGGNFNFPGSSRKDTSKLPLKTPSKENIGFMKPFLNQKLDFNIGEIHVDPIEECAEEMDFCTYKGMENYENSPEYIWSEMTVLSPEMIDKINAAYNIPDEEEEDHVSEYFGKLDPLGDFGRAVIDDIQLDRESTIPILLPPLSPVELDTDCDFWNEYFD